MSLLTLSKSYGDLTLLFAADVLNMWQELETKTNGAIDDDNLTTGWTSWASVTMSQDVHHYLGVTQSATLYYFDTLNELLFGFIVTPKDVLFKIAGTTVMTLETDNDINITKDVYFPNSDLTYPLSYLVGYSKPVLVYIDGTTIDIEQNTTIANRTLMMTPSGPISVTENTATTSKFRRLKLSEYANGYTTGHTGAANSGFRLTLSLVANTWYFVYAVRVQSGDDAVNPNFVLVADNVNPSPTNFTTLDGYYGGNNWVYVGLFRYGFGLASLTTLVPFVQDKSGWTNFIGRVESDAFFGIKTVSTSVTSTAYTTTQTYGVANSGNGAPITCSHMSIAYKATAEGAQMVGTGAVFNGADQIQQLPSFGVNLSVLESHGFQAKIPNIGCLVKYKTGTV